MQVEVLEVVFCVIIPVYHMLKISYDVILCAETSIGMTGDYLQPGKGAESEDSTSALVHEGANRQGGAATLSGRR